MTVAWSAFPSTFQLDLYSYQANKWVFTLSRKPCRIHFILDLGADGIRLSDEQLADRASSFMSKALFDQYLPSLQYCRDNGVRIYACGVPLGVTSPNPAPRAALNN